MKKKTNIIKTLFLSMVCSITIGLQSCGDYLDVLLLHYGHPVDAAGVPGPGGDGGRRGGGDHQPAVLFGPAEDQRSEGGGSG